MMYQLVLPCRLQYVLIPHYKSVGYYIEIPKHAGPTDKSGKNLFGPEKHWFPPDQLSGIKYWICCIKEPCLISNLYIIILPLPKGGGGYTVLPLSVQDIFRRIFLSNC